MYILDKGLSDDGIPLESVIALAINYSPSLVAKPAKHFRIGSINFLITCFLVLKRDGTIHPANGGYQTLIFVA